MAAAASPAAVLAPEDGARRAKLAKRITRPWRLRNYRCWRGGAGLYLPPVVKVAEGPAWLERGPVYAGSSSAYGSSPGVADGDGSGVTAVEQSTTDVTNFVQRLAKTLDAGAFQHLIQRVDAALRSLAQRGDAKAI